ncbi:hypothetical protein C8R48DRAFT_669131 [Suillus tomentosus]|nr:hypothetical protein C8R48DRAFT_669131 [Suillus tomentosus]
MDVVLGGTEVRGEGDGFGGSGFFARERVAREDNARDACVSGRSENARARSEGAPKALEARSSLGYTKIRENESVRTWDRWTDDSAKTYEEAREARIARAQECMGKGRIFVIETRESLQRFGYGGLIPRIRQFGEFRWRARSPAV